MTDNNALAQELETLRRRETQMLGAAISRRKWQEVEAAYNQLRDRQDGPIAAALRTPAPAPVGGDVVGLTTARGIVEADLVDAQEHGDADWEGQSRQALEAIDAALKSPPGPEQDAVERVAKTLAKADGLDFDEVCGVDANPDDGYCDSGTCVAAFYEDHDADHARGVYMRYARAALAAMPPKVEANGLPQDVVGLVIAARELVFSDHRPVGSPETQAEIELIELFDNLDTATEKFSEMVRWDNEPKDANALDVSETPSDDNQTGLPIADDTQEKAEAPAAGEVRELRNAISGWMETTSLTPHHKVLAAGNRLYVNAEKAADMLERLSHPRADAVAVEQWQPIETAPKDGTRIWAIIGERAGGQGERLIGRSFEVRHEGWTSGGYDMGWSLFPGYGGVPDEWLVAWMPLPHAPAAIRSGGAS